MKKEGYSSSQFRQVKAFLKASWVEVPDKTSESRIMRPRFATRDHIQEADDETSRTVENETRNLSRYDISHIVAQKRGNSGVSPFKDAIDRLPRGLECRQTSWGRTYYLDHNTKTTSWEFPKHWDRPRRWDLGQTIEGEFYYIDVNTQNVSFDRPSDMEPIELESSMTKKVDVKKGDDGKTERSIGSGNRPIVQGRQGRDGIRETMKQEDGMQAARSTAASAIYVSTSLFPIFFFHFIH